MTRALYAAWDFLCDLAWATKTLPAETISQWREAHVWFRPHGELVIVPDGNHQSLVYVEDPEYRLWKRLGYVTDAILVLIAVLVVFLLIALIELV